MGGWINSSQVTYRYDGMERLDYEKREDWMSNPDPAWVQTYLTVQEYDKKGNRTRFDKGVTAGQTASYGESMDLSYTYNAMNALSDIADAGQGAYECSVACDANNNIRMITETVALGESSATLYTSFGYDSAPLAEAQLPLRGVPHILPTLPCWDRRAGAGRRRIPSGGEELRCESIRRPHESSARRNRVRRVTPDWQLTRRDHDYDAAGRLVQSTYRQWWEKDEEPSGDSVEHCYAGSKHIQNFDGDSSYGEPWHWAGAQNAHAAPLKSPNADTASQDAFNIANDKTPQRTTWQTPVSAGDERNLYGQGKPMPKDSSGSGADWGTGIESVTVDATVLTANSRLAFDGTVAPTDLSRATDAREKGRIGIFGSALSFAGSSGRVTSEPLGRDLNPLGRGNGAALVGGAINLGQITPRLPGSKAAGGTGNSVNNCGQCGGGGDCGGGSYSPSCSPTVIPPAPDDADNTYWTCRTNCYSGRPTHKVEGCIAGCLEELRRRRAAGGSGGGSGGGTGKSDEQQEFNGNSWCYELELGVCAKLCRDGATCTDPIAAGQCNTTSCYQCGRQSYDLIMENLPFLKNFLPRGAFSCSYVMPGNRDLCLACNGYKNQINPCLCAMADCFMDCFADGSAGKNYGDCAEEISQLFEEFKCIPSIEVKINSMLDGEVQLSGGGNPKLRKCLERLKKDIQAAKDAANNGKVPEMSGNCLGCCVVWTMHCAETAKTGYCLEQQKLDIGEEWRGCILTF